MNQDRQSSYPRPGRENETQTSHETRAAFLELSSADAERLRQLAPIFDKHREEFADAFYGHLLDFETTARFLRDPQRLERLKAFQQTYFESLLQADWDEAYVERRQRVGDVHAEVGIDPHLFLGAYYQYIQFCVRRLSGEMGASHREESEWILSLLKAIFFDVGLTLHAYFEQSTHQLRDALDMLWKANHDLRQFARLTTHDLKTPLATLANLCDEAVDEFGQQMPPEARELVDTARQQAFRMGQMIDELLGEAIAPATSDHHSVVNLGDVFQEAIERIRPVLKKKSIDLVVPENWPSAWANKVRLREVVYNLLSNAVKFIDRCPGRIRITAEEDNAHCRFVVEDNGPGIPPDELERIFVPFRRMSMHRDRPGHGLGLYFAKTMIDDMGGRVWAESELGRSSRFVVELRRPTSPSAAN